MTKLVVIYSDYKHHSKNSGYKQIIKFTKPIKSFGINYNKSNNRFLLSYFYVHEFIARIKTFFLKFDILHIMYAEEYYRFSRWLFPFKKIVVTFHQPPEILKQELERGDFNGRIASITHLITKNRIKNVDAAIVISMAQKMVLLNYLPEHKISVIPLGVDVDRFNQFYNQNQSKTRLSNQILTVGEWQRDWSLYIKVIQFCKVNYSDLRFVLVNNRLEEKYRNELFLYDNVIVLNAISDEELYNYYMQSSVVFLPLKGAAGNNALNESLAFGCPVVTNIDHDLIDLKFSHIINEKSIEGISRELNKMKNINDIERKKISEIARNAISSLSWEKIAERHTEVYRSLFNKKLSLKT